MPTPLPEFLRTRQQHQSDLSQLAQVFKETADYFAKVAKLFQNYKPDAAADPAEGKKKKRKKKDPNAPKKPLTAFMLFTNFRRPQLLQEKPSIKITDVSVEIGKEWKEMSEVQQNVWKKKAQDAKLDYELKMYNYKREKEGAAAVEVDAADKKVVTESPQKSSAKEDPMDQLAGKKR